MTDEKHEKLIEQTKNTRFGGPNANPHHTQAGSHKPWSHRNAIRYIAAQKYDVDDKNSVKRVLPKQRTFAQGAALAIFTKALNGDVRANQMINEQIDGKLAQTNINADLAAIQEMSDGELLEQFRQVASAIESLGIGSNGAEFGDGDTAAGGSEEPSQIEDEHAGPTTDPESV